MKLKGKEKHFWKTHFNISNLEAIPLEMSHYTGIDSEEDDEFLFYLTSRVQTIHKINLRCTRITDEGVNYISNLKNLKELKLKNHVHITKKCLPNLNKLISLEYLDISKNCIEIEDLIVLSNLQNLKELHISSDESQEYISKKIKLLQAMLSSCIIYVNYEKQ